MNRSHRWYDLITINAFWLGLSGVSQTLTPLIIPLLVQQFVGEQLKGTYYGNIRLWTLMTAILAQSLMGTLSDRSQHPWGRRRPYILVGTLGVILLLVLIGLNAQRTGEIGYWILFGLMIILMVFINTAHGAVQGVIPDLVPEEKRGLYSAVKALFEVPLPVIFVSFTIARLVSKGNIWGGIWVLIGLLIVVLLVSMLIPEQRHQPASSVIDWRPFIRLVVMTGVFTLLIVIVGYGIRMFSTYYSSGLSPVLTLIVLGAVGVIAMLITILLGVLVSTRIGLGQDIKLAPSFPWWVINRLAFLVGSTNLLSFIIYFIQGRFGYSSTTAAAPAAMLTQFVGIFILLSVLPGGWLADRFGKKKLVYASGVFAIIGTLVAIFAPNLSVFYIGGIIIGIGIGQFYTANWALGTELVPQEHAGRFLGVSNLAGAGAGAIGAYLGGPLADAATRLVPEIPGGGYLLLFWIFCFLFVFSITTLTRIKEKF